MKRVGIAAAIAVVIYGVALAAGALLFATGAIATGATHNDCADFKAEIANERGIDEKDVPQQEVRDRTQACLDGHALTEKEAFRSEYLFWSAWPAAICAVIYLLWPRWVRILDNQEQSDVTREASNLEPGS